MYTITCHPSYARDLFDLFRIVVKMSVLAHRLACGEGMQGWSGP